MPENTQVFTGHDYPKDGEEPKWQSTILEQKTHNVFAKITNAKEYIKAREARDKALCVPKLLFPAIQILYDPLQLTENLIKKLKSSNERFEVKVCAYFCLITRF